MTEKTENRIWRGLFLAALVGVGIAATTQTASPKAVQYFTSQNGLGGMLLTEDGSVWQRKLLSANKDGSGNYAWKQLQNGSNAAGWVE